MSLSEIFPASRPLGVSRVEFTHTSLYTTCSAGRLTASSTLIDICSDKTGTITQGRMVVRKVWVPGCGTYSVASTSEVYNPTAGQVSLLGAQPKDAAPNNNDDQDESRLVSPRDEAISNSALRWYLNVAFLANLATVEQTDHSSANPGEWEANGAPTEIAIEVFANRFGWNRSELSKGQKAE